MNLKFSEHILLNMSNNTFDIKSLNQLIERDNAILIGQYDKLSQKTNIIFKCTCGNEYTKKFSTIIYVSGLFCKKCVNKKGSDKRRKTNIEKYGVECVTQNIDIQNKIKKTVFERYGVNNLSHNKDIQSKKRVTYNKNYGVNNPAGKKSIKDKIEKTCMERYGVKHFMKTDIVKDKIKKTCLKKYGVDCTLKSIIVRNKIKETFHKKYGNYTPFLNKNFKDKIKIINNNKFGVNFPFQSKNIRNKINTTFQKNYGGKSPFISSIIREKKLNTLQINYGVNNPLKSEIIKNKVKQTNIKKYGVEYPSQNIDVQEKIQKTSKTYKLYTMPSGKVVKIQGYEPFALNELITLYHEDFIKTNKKDVPRITYIDASNINHYYFPDIFISNSNKIIEVKSTWTYKCNIDINNLKAKACKDQGYIFEFWIYDRKGNKEIKI